MINESFVSYETAKLLKEAGFPQENGIYTIPLDSEDEVTVSDDDDIVCYSCSQAVAMRWLREKKRVSVRVNYSATYGAWFYDVLNLDTGEYYENDGYWDTYESAAEAGIQAACEYLIKEGGKE